MIDELLAKKRVSERLAKMAPEGDSWVIMEEKTLEKPFGWVFFYDSEKFVTTGKVMHRLAGNGPVLVNKRTGSMDFFGSLPTVDVILETYERNQG